MKARILESRIQLADRFLIGGRLHTAISVPKRLPNDAFLADLAVLENVSELFRIGKRGIGQPGDRAVGVEVKAHLPSSPGAYARVLVLGSRADLDHFLLAKFADSVEMFEPETDRVHQLVARRAARILDVGDHALPACLRLFRGRLRK